MILAVDFDGTLCTHAFPEIGHINQELFDKVLKLKNDGHQIVLWTCREGHYLKQAVDWCEVRGLKFDAVNRNIPEIDCNPSFARSKIYADKYLDDRNISIEEFVK